MHSHNFHLYEIKLLQRETYLYLLYNTHIRHILSSFSRRRIIQISKHSPSFFLFRVPPNNFCGYSVCWYRYNNYIIHASPLVSPYQTHVPIPPSTPQNAVKLLRIVTTILLHYSFDVTGRGGIVKGV